MFGRDMHLIDLEDLAVGLLHPVEHRHVVPEARLGDNLVGSEDVHLEDVRLASTLLRSRLQAAHHLVLVVPDVHKAALRRSGDSWLHLDSHEMRKANDFWRVVKIV